LKLKKLFKLRRAASKLAVTEALATIHQEMYKICENPALGCIVIAIFKPRNFFKRFCDTSFKIAARSL
jgi:hypothetical protein